MLFVGCVYHTHSQSPYGVLLCGFAVICCGMFEGFFDGAMVFFRCRLLTSIGKNAWCCLVAIEGLVDVYEIEQNLVFSC